MFEDVGSRSLSPYVRKPCINVPSYGRGGSHGKPPDGNLRIQIRNHARPVQFRRSLERHTCAKHRTITYETFLYPGVRGATVGRQITLSVFKFDPALALLSSVLHSTRARGETLRQTISYDLRLALRELLSTP